MGGSANEGITSGLDKPKRGLVDEQVVTLET